MRKKIVIFLWLSLVVLIIDFGLLVVHQNKQEAARLAEEARIEAEQERLEAEKEKAEEEAKELAEEGKAEEYTFTDMEATYYALSKATVRENPYDSAEIIGTLTIDQRVSVVAQCNETDYYKIKINGDYGYISPQDISEEYIDIPLPDIGAIPSATKDILFIGIWRGGRIQPVAPVALIQQAVEEVRRAVQAQPLHAPDPLHRQGTQSKVGADPILPGPKLKFI